MQFLSAHELQAGQVLVLDNGVGVARITYIEATDDAVLVVLDQGDPVAYSPSSYVCALNHDVIEVVEARRLQPGDIIIGDRGRLEIIFGIYEADGAESFVAELDGFVRHYANEELVNRVARGDMGGRIRLGDDR